jgi:hypothetical protein
LVAEIKDCKWNYLMVLTDCKVRDTVTVSACLGKLTARLVVMGVPSLLMD